MLRFLGLLILLLLAATWAVQNGAPVRIHVFLWTLPRVALSVVLLVSFLLGAMAAALAVLPQYIRLARRHATPASSGTPSETRTVSDREHDARLP